MAGVFLVSLGCPKNLVDTEILAGMLVSSNYQLMFDAKQADVYLINTCAFIPSARSEAAEAVKTALKWKKKKAGRKVVVAGCLNQFAGAEEYRNRFAEVDIWLGVNDIPNLVEKLEHKPENLPAAPADYLYDHTTPRLQLTSAHVAYLKIADGCNNRCSYCAIPSIRGELRSRNIKSVLIEAENLLKNGVREIVLIAQDITVFGVDRPDEHENLAMLLTELEKLPGDFKIRLLYTHPAHYSDELIAVLSQAKKVLPYIDIPLQHCNDRILKAMNRHVDKAATEILLDKLRKNIPNLVLRTTFITGFPGETEEEFAELLEFVKKWKFERCGVFGFSPEQSTPAAELSEQINLELANERAAKLMKIQEKIMNDFQKSLIGKSLDVIADEVEGNMAIGRGFADAPEIDNQVIFGGLKLKTGKTYQVKIEAVDDFNLIGKVEVKK